MLKKILLLGVLLAGVRAFGQSKGVLRVVVGDVHVRNGENGPLVSARQGIDVGAKDAVITGDNGKAKIEMPDKNEISLSQNTNFLIQDYEDKKVLLNLIYGRVRAQVMKKYDGKDSKFQIFTPSAVTGVRGTDFLVSYDRAAKTSEIITFKGNVEFGQKGPNGTIVHSVQVAAGKTSRMQKGHMPGWPTSVSADRLKQLEQETRLVHADPKEPFHMAEPERRRKERRHH